MSGIEIEIISSHIDVRGGTIKSGDRAGQPWEVRSQEGYVYNGHAHPERCNVNLPPSHAGYAPGRYYIDPVSVVVGDFKALAFERALVLKPVIAEAAKPVKAVG